MSWCIGMPGLRGVNSFRISKKTYLRVLDLVRAGRFRFAFCLVHEGRTRPHVA